MKKFKIIRLLMGLGIVITLSSCVNMKKATYFYNVGDSTFRGGPSDDFDPILQKNDILSISVNSVNPEASELFNVPNLVTTQSSTVGAGNITQVSGYLIDQDGFIRFPVLGQILAAGKSKKTLREEITSELETRKILIDPIVDIRYLNFKISVLGEVEKPAVITIPNEKVSLLEALGLAGDITIFGNKESVVLIREENRVKIFRRIDLTSENIFNSPYYYLKSNDIIYVEPNKSKVMRSSQITQWIPVALSAISLAIIAIVNFK